MAEAERFFAAANVAAAPRELIAVGGTLDVATLVAAYRAGCFPWPSEGPGSMALRRAARRLVRHGEVAGLPGPDAAVPWCSPDPRAVLIPERLVVPKSLRQRLRGCGWTTTLDTAFADVITACAQRPDTWITERMIAAYIALHNAGHAHSVEVWEGERLVGGLYGVRTGAVFSGESMFHRESDAGKVAVVDLCGRLREAGMPVVDTQQETEHLRRLGQVLVTRADYLTALSHLRDRAAVIPSGRRAAAALASRPG
ncbi:MAG TPA: leucyl/phenylalanyl-tRNA--protein transferase [Mycobacteriales bacterium]|nr:leucyl/phenylalanyl-tRNA--protein transferase [Mycobacteriales bacterium]